MPQQQGFDFFTSYVCGFTNTAFQNFRLSNISVRSTQILLFSLCGSFIHLLSAIVTMVRLQVSVFSIFIIIAHYSQNKSGASGPIYVAQ